MFCTAGDISSFDFETGGDLDVGEVDMLSSGWFGFGFWEWFVDLATGNTVPSLKILQTIEYLEYHLHN